MALPKYKLLKLESSFQYLLPGKHKLIEIVIAEIQSRSLKRHSRDNKAQSLPYIHRWMLVATLEECEFMDSKTI